MKRRNTTASTIIAGLATVALACVPDGQNVDRDPGNDFQPPPDQGSDVTIVIQNPDGTERTEVVESVTVNPDKFTIRVDDVQIITASANLSDGTTVDISGQVTWSIADEAVAAIDGGTITGQTEGQTDVTAAVGNLRGTSIVTVIPADSEPPPPPPPPVVTLLSIALDAIPTDMTPGETHQIVVTGSYSDNTTADVTAEASFVSSNPNVVAVSEAGLLSAVGAGDTDITVTFEDQNAAVAIGVTCAFPNVTNPEIRRGGYMPEVSWPEAYDGDGNQISFTLEDTVCDPQFSDVSVIIFKIGAAWCGPCTSYAQSLAPRVQDIRDAGGLVVWVEVETTSYQPSSSAYAQSHLSNIIGTVPSIRVGDGETMPTTSMFRDAPLVTQFPTIFVVRKRDMKILVDQQQSNGMLPFEAIARNPEGDWSNPNAPPFSSNCGPNDEEIYEPNDMTSQAAAIEPGTFEGGICTSSPDYYQVNVAGDWRLDLTVQHSVGDIDVFAVNPSTGQPISQGGQQVGSDSGTDNETFTHSGPAMIKVFGYENASSPYTLTLTEL